jgi:hypothetical protein
METTQCQLFMASRKNHTRPKDQGEFGLQVGPKSQGQGGQTFDSEDEDEDEDELVPINKTAALIAASLQPKKKLPRRSN